MKTYVEVRFKDEDTGDYMYDTYLVHITSHAIDRAWQRCLIPTEAELLEKVEELLWTENVMDIFLNGVPCNETQLIIRDIYSDFSIAVVSKLNEDNEPEIVVKTVGRKLDVGDGELSIRIYDGVAKLYRWVQRLRLFKEVEVY
jgi:hypothetical protein